MTMIMITTKITANPAPLAAPIKVSLLVEEGEGVSRLTELHRDSGKQFFYKKNACFKSMIILKFDLKIEK